MCCALSHAILRTMWVPLRDGTCEFGHANCLSFHCKKNVVYLSKTWQYLCDDLNINVIINSKLISHSHESMDFTKHMFTYIVSWYPDLDLVALPHDVCKLLWTIDWPCGFFKVPWCLYRLYGLNLEHTWVLIGPDSNTNMLARSL